MLVSLYCRFCTSPGGYWGLCMTQDKYSDGCGSLCVTREMFRFYLTVVTVNIGHLDSSSSPKTTKNR